MACGNGGSMCDAMHFASELSGKYKDVRTPLAAMALSDSAAMSCISNDFGYSHAFRRQVAALGQMGDVLLAISTSGRSPNVNAAIDVAKKRGMLVIGLTGYSPMNEFVDGCDIVLNVPSTSTNYIQELHIKIIHILVELIEKNLQTNEKENG